MLTPRLVHLHGHTFQVLYRSPPKTKYSQDAAYPVPENPIQRDVLVVNPGGFAIVAFRADNPGVWFFVLFPVSPICPLHSLRKAYLLML